MEKYAHIDISKDRYSRSNRVLYSFVLPSGFFHSNSPYGRQIESIPGWMPLAWGWIAMIFIQPPTFA
jgi:hypothetical protein